MSESDNLATPVQRLAAWVMDMALLTAVWFALRAAGLDASGGSGFVAGLALTLVYFIPLEATSGMTFGKRLIGTRVVSEDGATGPIGIGRAMARRVIYLLGPLGLFFPWLRLIWDSRRQALHDVSPGTLVVRSR